MTQYSKGIKTTKIKNSRDERRGEERKRCAGIMGAVVKLWHKLTLAHAAGLSGSSLC